MTNTNSRALFSALFAGAVLLAASPLRAASAQAASPVTSSGAQASVAPTADDARELRRILHLANGQTIRVVARWKDDHWEYKHKDAWKALAAGQVSSVVLESEALNAWNASARRADPKDLDARVVLARAALEQGLVHEALGELDQVLAREPDHAGVLALVAQHRDMMSVPPLVATGSPTGNAAGDPAAGSLAGAKEALYRWAAAMPSPAARELAVLELATLCSGPAGSGPAGEEVRGELERELRSNVVTRRAFATLALRRLFPSAALKPLVMHAVLDPSEDVRAGASYALRATKDAAVILPVARALADSASSTVRTNAAQALGNMGYPAAVEPLISRLATASAAQSSANRLPHAYIFVGKQRAYIQDFDVEVAQFQAVADPQMNVLIEGMVTDAAVGGVNQVVTTVEVATIRKSLAKLTGANPGNTSKDWLAWWEDNAARWSTSAQSGTEPVKTGG